MFINQISVYLENSNGTLRSLTKILAEKGIDLLAMSMADTTHFGIVRIIVRESDIESAVISLRENGFISKTNRVLCVSVPNEPAGLDKVLSVIEENNISIEYLYSLNYIIENNASIVLRLSSQDMEKKDIADIMQQNNIKTIDQETINKL